MSNPKFRHEPDPFLTDDENPELTDDEIRNARPAHEVLPGLLGPKAAAELLTKRSRGRPPVEKPKVSQTLRLDADVLGRFRDTGDGWQTRINDALKAVVLAQKLMDSSPETALETMRAYLEEDQKDRAPAATAPSTDRPTIKRLK